MSHQLGFLELPPDRLASPPRFTASKPQRKSRQSADADFFAAYFKARPNVWISALELMQQRACLSFRTRLSDLRYPPYDMQIDNKQERHKGSDGRMVTHSFYRYGGEK